MNISENLIEVQYHLVSKVKIPKANNKVTQSQSTDNKTNMWIRRVDQSHNQINRHQDWIFN
jgi:hypothetical protein